VGALLPSPAVTSGEILLGDAIRPAPRARAGVPVELRRCRPSRAEAQADSDRAGGAISVSRGGGSWPARPVLAANTNSRRGSCS
jgi:hypothetical protein